jgi:hypothetical protein
MSRPARYEPPAGALAAVGACLATRQDPRAEDWAALENIRDVLRQRDVRRAGLMPQLLQAATEAGVRLDPTLRSLCRAARAHEELRIAAMAPTCRRAVGVMEGDAVVLRGVALGHTVYAHPALRHCHDLDLLVPAASLLDVCVQAATHGPPRSPLWCIDAALLIRSGPLDWDRAVSRAREWRIAGHAAITLSWLRERLGIPVPLEVVRALRPRRWWRPGAGRTLRRARELAR